MRQLARAEYLMRHIRTFSPYITPAKIYNIALNALELWLKVARPRSLPPYLKVEPTPLCHMACLGCAHGDSELKKEISAGRDQLRLDEFKRIIDPVASAVFGVSLSLRGEPLLGKDLLPIIEYSHAKNVAVSFPSNLSVKLNRDKVVRLVESGVDTIYVSLDGASKETYDKYRIGGDFNLVLRNVAAIARAKNELRRSRPRLVWKFVILAHNKHEIPAVRTEYRRLGFDAYELVEDYDSESAKSAQRTYNANLVRRRKGCYWAWHTTTVRADGVVTPCCFGHHNFGLGNALADNLRDIWRGEGYKRLRQGFQTMRAPDLHPLCARCLGVKGDRDELRVSPQNPAGPSTVRLS